MKSEEIVIERKKIEEEIKKLSGMIVVERAKLRSLQMQCNHENEYSVSSMGEKSLYCPDCGRNF